MAFSGTPIIGQFYIQKENQDFWLYEMVAGVPQWVRKGNIRDEGTGGLVNVPPVVAHGFNQDIVHLDLWRYLPDQATPTPNDFGFITNVAALDRIRYLGGIPIDLGLMVPDAVVQRTRFLVAAYNLGHINTTQLTHGIQLQAAMALGFTMAAGADSTQIDYLVSNQSIGFSVAALSLQRSRELVAAFALGFGHSTIGFQKFLVAAPALGFNLSVTALQRIKQLTAAMALGYTETNTVDFYLQPHYLPTNNTLGPSVGTPSAVNTTFVYNAGGGAAQSNLYDGNDATPAADARGLSTDTHAAYDFGSAVRVNGARLITAAANGFTNAAVFKIQWSDTSLTGPWIDSGTTVTVPAGNGQAVSSSTFEAELPHRYWQITYVSGTTLGNAWLGELTFERCAPWSLGFNMTSLLARIKAIPALAPSEGFTMAATVAHFLYKGIVGMSPSEGFTMGAISLLRSKMLTAAFGEGFTMAAAVTNTAAVFTPTSVNTSFTYTGQTPAASEAALYDSSDTTDAADPGGLTAATFASYDLGSAKAPSTIRVVNSPRFTSSTPITYAIHYSDGSIVGTWVDTGVRITMPATLGAVQSASLAGQGSHRFWKLVYFSGTTGQNAWLGSIQYRS